MRNVGDQFTIVSMLRYRLADCEPLPNADTLQDKELYKLFKSNFTDEEMDDNLTRLERVVAASETVTFRKRSKDFYKVTQIATDFVSLFICFTSYFM